MRILVDMNLTPDWVRFFSDNGMECQHWSKVGAPTAQDKEVMAWARQGEWLVFTNDLDFGALLALAGAIGPSVVLVRTQDVLPGALGSRILPLLREHATELALGALLVLDETTTRVRLLPVRSRIVGPKE